MFEVCLRLSRRFPRILMGFCGFYIMITSRSVFVWLLSPLTFDLYETPVHQIQIILCAQMCLRTLEWIWNLIGFSMVVAAIISVNGPRERSIPAWSANDESAQVSGGNDLEDAYYGS